MSLRTPDSMLGWGGAIPDICRQRKRLCPLQETEPWGDTGWGDHQLHQLVNGLGPPKVKTLHPRLPFLINLGAKLGHCPTTADVASPHDKRWSSDPQRRCLGLWVVFHQPSPQS